MKSPFLFDYQIEGSSPPIFPSKTTAIPIHLASLVMARALMRLVTFCTGMISWRRRRWDRRCQEKRWVEKHG